MTAVPLSRCKMPVQYTPMRLGQAMESRTTNSGPAYIKARGEAVTGMTLRDYFAAKAMNGICAHHDTWGLAESEMAEHAYRIADAMLAARVKP